MSRSGKQTTRELGHSESADLFSANFLSGLTLVKNKLLTPHLGHPSMKSPRSAPAEAGFTNAEASGCILDHLNI